MSEDGQELRVTDNPSLQRFEARVGECLAAVAVYRLEPGRVVFTHTETFAGYEGRGIASRLAGAALDEARARGLRVTPVCPFIAGYIRKHPEYADLRALRTH
ncbi:MAG TPA: GNAT family N-acetyltransferase [Candidatus Dormibacteraeota bacterium]